MPPFRAAFTKLVTTDTSSTSLVVGGANGAATTGTGGVVAGALILPSNVPSPTTNALYNDAGTLKWNGSAIGAPAGATNDVQINVSGAFGVDTGVFTYNPSTHVLGVNNIISQTGSNLAITSAAGTTQGRHITITGGSADTTAGAGGNVTIAGGSTAGGSSMTSGGVTIKSGDVQNGLGAVLITTGALPAAGYAAPGTKITIQPATPETDTTNPTGSIGVGVLVEAGPGAISDSGGLSNGTGGAGGALVVRSGAGGNVLGNNNTRTGGNAADVSLLGGAGGSATGSGGTRNGGNGGNVIIGSGAGGTGASANGTAGTITFNIGATTATSIDATGTLIHPLALRLTGTISPTQLVANTDNWNPTGLSTANVIRIDVSGAINLTGIVAQASGTMIVLYNRTASVISLIHDATSTAANRFYCPGGIDFPLSARGSCWIRYDGTDSRWAVFI